MEKLLQLKPFESQLDILFKKYFDKIQKAPLVKLSELKNGELPKIGGLYVFYEEIDQPIYVGRTKNIRQRIQLHTRNSSKNESATFAFFLARIQYRISFPHFQKATRKDLMNNVEFIPFFSQQKKRVQNMYLKYIEEEHDILQTILEPYFAFKLKTYPQYNTFETH